MTDFTIDYHCHILPAIDDGARHLDDSLAIASQLVAAGVKVAYCTPHNMRGVYDTTPAMVRAAVTALQSQLDAATIALELRPGMEYYLDEFFPQALSDPLPLGDTKLLLVEAPNGASPQLVQENIFQAVRQGFTPLFAHPERVPFLDLPQQKNGLFNKLARLLSRDNQSHNENPPTMLELLQQQGCLLQGNLGSLVGYYGHEVQNKAQLFHQAGLYHCFGSDAHTAERLSRYLDKALLQLK